MRNLILSLILLVISSNIFAQSAEVITKERAIQIVDSLKKINGQAFKHILATEEFFENTESQRNIFFKCLNTVSSGYRFPTPTYDETTLLLAEGELPWNIETIDYGVHSWEEDKTTSLGNKIWIYYYLPEINDKRLSTTVYIGFICSPQMCNK